MEINKLSFLFILLLINRIDPCPFKNCKEYENPVDPRPLCVCGEGLFEFKFEKNNPPLTKNYSILKIYNFKSIPAGSFSGLNIEELILSDSRITVLRSRTLLNLSSIKIIQLENLFLTRIETGFIDFLSKTIIEMRLINVKPLNVINFSKFGKLVTLDIQSSYIHLLRLTKSSSLGLVRIKNSRIDYLNVYDLPNLSDFYLQKNRLRNFKIWNTAVSFMDISSNIISNKFEIKNSKKLKSLILDYNNLNDTHTKIFRNLTDLENLSIIGNSIQNVSFLNDMSRLINLDLSQNRIKTFDIKVPGSLITLRLDKNFIQNDLKFDMNSLKILSLTDNNITNFYIENQNFVSSVNLNRNPLKNITFINCPKIDYLQFRDLNLDGLIIRNVNLLSQMDLINVKWKNLIMENLANLININTINTTIFDFLANAQIPSLQDLMVAKSNLSSIPENNLSKFRDLIGLDFTENNLNSFNNISFYKNKLLGLSNNKFSNSEDLYTIINNNLYVDLSYNMLKNLSLEGKFSKTMALDLSFNRIDSFKILNFSSLLTLRLSKNSLSFFRAEFMPKLVVLDLSNNKISYQNFIISLDIYENLNELDLSENNLIDFSFDLFKNLSKLSLSRNNFTSLNYVSRKLIELDVSFNKLTDLSFLINLPNLENLKASDNFIRSLDINVFKNNRVLKSVDLSNNYLNIIPSIDGLNYFQYLNMSFQNGQLAEIKNYSLSNQNDKIKKVDLSLNDIKKFGNKMLCSESNSLITSYSIYIDCNLRINKCIYQNLARFMANSKCFLNTLNYNCHQNMQFVFHEPSADACPKS